MSDTTTAAPADTTPEATTDAPAPAEQAPDTNTPTPVETPAEGQQAEWDGKVESLPDGAQKIIRDLRKDDGDERVAARTLAAIQQALNPEAPADEKPTPEALATQVTEHQQAAETAVEGQQAAERKLAVVMAAISEGADHEALLDSNNFLATVKGLDPSTDSEKITAAVKEAVSNNQRFQGTRAVPRSRADTSGGSGEGAISQERFDAMPIAERNELFHKNSTLYRQLAGN